jgi:hypothetical protein
MVVFVEIRFDYGYYGFGACTFYIGFNEKEPPTHGRGAPYRRVSPYQRSLKPWW